MEEVVDPRNGMIRKVRVTVNPITTKGDSMKKLITLFIAASLILVFGCRHTSHVSQSFTYKIFVPPDTEEGKKCTTTCKRVELQCKQRAKSIASEPFRKGLNCDTVLDLNDLRKDFEYMSCERGYKQCFIDCGGTIETKTKT